MKSFIEMICEADQSEEQVEVRIKEIKDKKTPSKILVGFLKNSNQRVAKAAKEELLRRKQAGEDTAGHDDEDPMTDKEGQQIPPEVEVNTGEELPVNADSIARELNTKVHPDDEKDKKNKQLKVKPNEIILNPDYQARIGISEAKERSVVFSFARMNPITVGHEKLVAKIVNIAKKKGADPIVFVSTTQDNKNNPLSYEKKLKYAKIAFPKVVRDLPKHTKVYGVLVGLLKSLDSTYDHITMVVGSDRVDGMKYLLNKHNGKEFSFTSFDVVSAGERDPEADDVSGISASKMRMLAKQGDFDSFKQGLPSKLKSSAKSMYDDVRSAMLNEEELSEKVLTVQQRLKKRAVMKRSKGRVRVGQRKAIRRKASGKIIDRRSKRLAIRFMRKRILKGKKYNDLSYSARAAVDRIVARRAVAIKRIAQRLSPKIRRSESQRKSGGGFKSVSLSPSRKVRKENFERYVDMFGEYMTEQNFLDFVHIAFDDLSEEFTVDMTFSEEQYLMKKSEQTGESFETLKKVFDRGVASWNMGLHEDVTPQQWAFARVNSYINEGASRKTADVDLTEAEMFGISKAISPIIHMHSYKAAKKILQQVWDRKKDEAAKVSRDRGPKHAIEWYAAQIARQYHGVDAKKLAKMVSEEEKKDSYGNPINVADIGAAIMTPMSFKQFIKTDRTEKNKKNVSENSEICETASAGLAAKADKSGVSIGTLRKVYKRGVAAWNSGHRPGTTPEQWGMARVNSYITKGKGTYHGADKDLREEQIDESGGEVVWKKGRNHIEKYGDDSFALYVDGKKQKFFSSIKAAQSAIDLDEGDVSNLRRTPKDKETGLPKKYVAGVSDSTAKARAAHFSKTSKMSDSNPRAYEPAPGDATAKTKESQHTKKYRAMFGEDMNEEMYEACWRGYKQVGTKKKGDRIVPNCVPKEEYGAGFEGTSELTKKYKKDTPCQESVEIDESTQYKLHHSTYSSAINHALAHHEKRGLKVHDDDRWDKVAVGPRKPSEGKTVSVNIPATHTKTGKKHMVHVQVYNKGGNTPYELNTYSSTHRSMQKEALDKDADAGDYIDDFQKSDAPQFQGKSKEKRRQMAVAAYMSKKNQEVELDESKQDINKIIKTGRKLGSHYSFDGLYVDKNNISSLVSDLKRAGYSKSAEVAVKGTHRTNITFTSKGKPDIYISHDGQSKDADVSYDRRVIESVELDEARKKQAVAGNKVQKLVTAFGTSYKGKNYNEIDLELMRIDNSAQIVTFRILHPKEHIGDKVNISFTSLRRGSFWATDTSKINEDSVEIVELSKDTMRNYASKAMGDASKKSTSSMNMELQARQMKKQSGDSNTSDRLMKASQDLDDKAKRRMKFARKALGKLDETDDIEEATYQGKEVPLNKPMAGDVKKSKVYVDPDGDGNAQKVNFGDKNMTIKKDIPARRKSFRARHKCDTAKDKTTPRYWSCKAW